jgi:uracil-DNA glycosylase
MEDSSELPSGLGRWTTALRQKVYDDWKHGAGPCSGCPLSGPCLGEAENENYKTDPRGSPDFAGLNPDAPIMLVNNTPGYDSNNTERPYYGNPPEEHLISPPDRKDSLHEGEHPPGYPKGDTHDIYTYKIIQEWPNVNKPIENLIEHSNQLDWNSFYYTNSMKCSEYRDDFDKKSEIESDARESCQNHLSTEIDEIVKPEVIITGGPSATESVFNTLEMNISIPSRFSQLIDQPEKHQYGKTALKHGAYGEDPVIIPTYQFSSVWQNWSNPRWMNKKSNGGEQSEYYIELLRRVNHHLS